MRSAIAIAVVAAVSLLAVPAAGAVEYQLKDSFTTTTEPEAAAKPLSISIDQSAGFVYVSENVASGRILKFDLEGNLLDTFGPVGTARFSGVAVNPTNGNVYGYARNVEAGVGEIITFDSTTGEVIDSFEPAPEALGPISQIAADSNGNVFVPVEFSTEESTILAVREFSSAGTLLQTIACTACEPAGFSNIKSVAVDSTGNIYVSDGSQLRIVKLGPEGDADSTAPVNFQSSGEEVVLIPAGVAVNSATDDVFSINQEFVIATETSTAPVYGYESTGNPLTSFDSLVAPGGVGLTRAQLAILASDGSAYVVDEANRQVLLFAAILPPTVTTGAPSGIGKAAATLRGTVNPNSRESEECFFEYGTTTGYGQIAPCNADPGEGNEPVEVSAAVSGLAPGTEYHYRLVASNTDGESQGGDETFETLPQLPPLATTGAATGISQAAATLNATVNAEGASTSCLFEYGTTAAYGKTAACSVNPVTGEAETAVSAAASGLSASTAYHFRVVAENPGGSAEGNDATFTTPAGTCETNAALCPPAIIPPAVTPPTTTPPAKKPLKCKKGFKKKTVKGKKKCVKAKKKHKKR